MYYFGHYLAAAGVAGASRVTIARVTDAAWVYDTLREELLDVFPDAAVAVHALDDLPASSDLLVLPLTAAYEFPLQDVVYRQLALLEAVARLSPRFAYALVYRARWREVEVVAARDLAALVRRRRREKRAIGLCQRSSLLRRLLRPRYPN
jgi:hypothetical protein